MSSSKPAPERRLLPAYVAIGAATALWGFNYTFAKLAVQEIEPFAVALVRVLVATPVLFLLAGRGRVSGRFRPTRTELWLALPLGLTGILCNQLFFIIGIRRTTPAHSSLVVALIPVVVLILAALLLGERITPLKGTGIALAFSGILVISLREGWTFSQDTLIGDLLTLCGVIGFAYYTVAARRVIPLLGARRTTALVFFCGGLVMMPLVLPVALRQPWETVTVRGWVALSYVVLVGTVSCYLLYFLALARIQASKVAVFAYLQPIVAGIFSHLVLGEEIGIRFLVGGLAVLAGVYLAERK